ncbi:MAG TPA: transposase [Spirochaetota bacterium]|nr:transposase [Spirochaetota bacterium]
MDRSLRLQNWDYCNEGHYFVTIGTKNREPYFGEITDGEMVLSEPGMIAEQELLKTGETRRDVFIDEFCIMPDHVHCIVHISVMDTTQIFRRGRSALRPHKGDVMSCVPTGDIGIAPLSPSAGSLSVIIRSYKSAVTKRCRDAGHKGFAWQSRFYDRIIRDQDELRNVRRYIRNNVKKWAEKHVGA